MKNNILILIIITLTSCIGPNILEKEGVVLTVKQNTKGCWCGVYFETGSISELRRFDIPCKYTTKVGDKVNIIISD